MVVLKDVTLAAIVRDEMMNPAGGIAEFLANALPYVEEAVLVDTGSVDGTREVLDDSQAEYPHMRIYDHQFNGYAQSRDFSLAQVRTRYALVLDADEVLTPEDFVRLGEFMSALPEAKAFRMEILDIFHDHEWFGPGHYTRLFRADVGMRFVNTVDLMSEFLYDGDVKMDDSDESVRTGAYIKHYKPHRDGLSHKRMHWYGLLKTGLLHTVAPSEIPESYNWRAPNPKYLEWKNRAIVPHNL